MASNNVTMGFGRSLLTGGFAGTGLATGTVELIQNPSFETAGASAGEAANWTVTIVSSAAAFAAFTRPGLSVVTDTVPATLGDLGITIVDNGDGTITLLEAADVQAAQEDFEAGWSNNDQYLFVFPGTALDDCFFGVREIEDFENGWLNDPGELDVFDEVASAIASFSHRINPSTLAVITDEFDSFEGKWPATAPNFFVSQIPEVVFGTATYQGAYEQNSEGIITTADTNGHLQYADALLMTVTDDIPDALTITITYLDKDDHVRTTINTVAAHTPVGRTISISSQYVGVRSVDSVTATTVMPGVVFHGDPGFFLDPNQEEFTWWERAEFEFGWETFQHGWHNDTWQNRFDAIPLASAGFNWSDMGAIDLGTNIYNYNAVFSLPNYGVSPVACVNTMTGFSVTPNILTISYLNQIGAANTTTFGPVVAGAPIHSSYPIELAIGDSGLIWITNVTASAAQTGLIVFKAAPAAIERFLSVDEWPDPDPGL